MKKGKPQQEQKHTIDPSKQKQYARMARLHKWAVRVALLVLVIAFFLPEPWNECILYVAWALFGLPLGLWGLAAVLTRRAAYQIVDMWMSPVSGEGETQGAKAVAVGLLGILFALLCFILPGLSLALGILLK